MECVRVAAELSLDKLPELRERAQAHESPTHRVQRGPRTRGCLREQVFRCGKACGLLECFCANPVAFPFGRPAARAGSGAARAEEQQRCWVCPWCPCCKGTSLSPNTLWRKDVHWEKSCGCPKYPGSVCQSHEPVQPIDLCAVQGLPCAGNPWAPRKQLPTPFSVVKVLPVVWTCYEALLSNGMLGDSCRGGVGCAGLGSGRRDEASLMGEGGKRVAGGFGFCVSVFPTR